MPTKPASLRPLARLLRPLLRSIALTPLIGCAVLMDFQDATDLPLEVDAAASLSEKVPGQATGLNANDGGSVPDGDLPADTGSKSDASATTEAGPTPLPCECVAVPAGWEGPSALLEGTAAQTLAACSGDYPTTVYEGAVSPVAPSAECVCSCGVAQGISCAAPAASYFRDRNCQAACTSATAIATTPGCTRLTTPSSSSCSDGDVRSFSLATPTAVGGACAPVASTNVQAPRFAGRARLCSTAGGPAASLSAICGAARACAARPTSPFAGGRCVSRIGEWACPSDYPTKHVYYDDTKQSDNRGCSACTCGAPVGASCTASASLYSLNSCASPTATTSLPINCQLFASSMRANVTTPTPQGGTCAASGGVPNGSFYPGTPTTVCCE